MSDERAPSTKGATNPRPQQSSNPSSSSAARAQSPAAGGASTQRPAGGAAPTAGASAQSPATGGTAPRAPRLWPVAAALGLGLVILMFFRNVNVPTEGGDGEAPAPVASVGAVFEADITLVTADRNDLDCAAHAGVNQYQCAFSEERTSRTVEERSKLRPFMTTDRRLFLIPGLFFEPAIDGRYKSEPPNKPRTQLKRFSAKCQISVVGTLDGVKARWAPDGEWEDSGKVPVATVSGCQIAD